MTADPELNPRFLLRDTKVGEYTIQSPIDEGGQGVVYRVSRGPNVFTLKMATGRRAQRPDSDQVEIDGRLRREVATLLAINHPNVVKVISLDWWPEVETGHPYFVMEHVEGDPVLRWQQKAHPSLRAICGVLLQAAGALRALHEHGILHRDLKSGNLLVREDGTPVIVDFGLAWHRSAWTLTAPSSVLGTKTHLSPDYCRHFREHAEDGERYVFQPTDDTHALGYIFYEMLVGRPPFDPEEFEQEYELMLAIGRRVPARPRELNPKVPSALDDIVMALLEKEGERRMDAPKLVAALEKALSEADAEWDVPFDARSAQPAAAPAAKSESPPPPAEPDSEALPDEDSHGAEEAPAEFPRRTRRRPALVVIGALALATLAALLVWGAFHSRRTTLAPAATPAGAPHEPPMPPTAEQGRPPVNEETKPTAPAAAAAKAAPAAPARTTAARLCKVMTAAGMVMTACVHHVYTGTNAGDCSVDPVREVPAPRPEYALDLLERHIHDPALVPGGAKLRIPPELPVALDPSNPEGECKYTAESHEPCPIWEGRIVLYVDGKLWGANGKGSLLIGETYIIPYKETRTEKTGGPVGVEIDRDVTGRMTARFTHLQTPDGTMWPVCGVLFGWDGKEGVQILSPQNHGKPTGAPWGSARVRFFWSAP